jgi:hypothetical protein
MSIKSKEYITSKLRLMNQPQRALDRSQSSLVSSSINHDSNMNKKIAFSSLILPRKSMDTHLANKYFQMSINDFDETKIANHLQKSSNSNRKKSTRNRNKSTDISLTSFFLDECNSSEVGKVDLHRKIIGIN